MPADISIMQDGELAERFKTYWQTPQCDAITRMKLFKLAWDMVGSEFAGRHQQYEKFYGGSSSIVKQSVYRNFDFKRATALVDKALNLAPVQVPAR